jgi:2-dehydro-3-deoxygluconokinase
MTDPRFDVTTFGEMMLRLSVPSGERLETATRLDVYPAGAESNVVSLLARLERKARWVGALPENPLGRLAANALRASGVDLGGVLWNPHGRMGTYYVEFGAPPRGIQATYDRAGSCTAQLKPDDLDWASLLDTRLLHLTGIAPALSDSCHEIVVEALQRAKQAGIPVSFDVNYRQKLWPESEAATTLTPLMQGVELLFCSQADATRLFGCHGPMQDVAQDMLEISHARYVVVTFGEQGAMLWDGMQWLHEPACPTQIIDRLGAGDALAAGVINGWLSNDISNGTLAALGAGLRDGVALAALALSQLGDMVVTNKAELLALSRGGSTLVR